MTTVLAGYDGSPASSAAIDAGARLLPSARATIAYLWEPPFSDNDVRQRLWRRAQSLDELVNLLHEEGAAAAERLAADGAALAAARGWDAEPLVRRAHGGEGYELAGLADELDSDVILVGSRGLGGVRAMLGSTSDLVVHVSSRPVAVVPHALLKEEWDAAAAGPILVGYDGSAGARKTIEAAVRLFPDRKLIVATVSAIDANVAEHETLRLAGAEQAEMIVLEADRQSERSVAEALVRSAAEHRAAAIAVGSRGQSATRKILLGSVAMSVLHEAQRPVLVVPGERFD